MTILPSLNQIITTMPSILGRSIFFHVLAQLAKFHVNPHARLDEYFHVESTKEEFREIKKIPKKILDRHDNYRY